MNLAKFENDINDYILNCLKDLSLENKEYSLEIDKIPTLEFEIPKDKKFGNLSTNIALKLSRVLKKNPLMIAKSLETILNLNLRNSAVSDCIGRFEAVVPGFINIYYSTDYLYETLRLILKESGSYGRVDSGFQRKVMVEFVSANPTGPLTVAHGRQAAVGDTLANILEFAGYLVTREYYNNDEGNQINTLGKSIMARCRELINEPNDFPEDGYKGGYIYDIAKIINQKYPDRIKSENFEFFGDVGYKIIMEGIIKDLEDFGVKFDIWYSQRELRQSGKIEETLKILRDKGYIYDQEGAVFFKSTLFGDDKDRVVIKSDKSFTYLAPDIAYHLDKYRRKFEILVNLWGPDHHGYIPRMKAAIEALGFKRDTLNVVIVQLATLYREGKALSMSTRAGEFITLREVMDEVGRDAARFFFLMRKTDSHLDFDIELAKKHSLENPVYYIQYAHARICNILLFKKERNIDLNIVKLDLALLKSDEELELVAILNRFPLAVKFAAKELEPYRIVNYLVELATGFHGFYAKHRVVGDDLGLTNSRLALVECIKITLSNGLQLLGVTAPERM